jgi:chromosomal replication initiation ATPase DnaA
MTSQFVLPFTNEPVMDAATFITAPCNEQAFRFIARWPDWPAPAAAVYGPAGCGKTHLATIWRDVSGARVFHARDLASAFAAGQACSGPSIVEDLDRAPADASRDRVLIELFDRRNPMLLTGRSAPALWNAATGDWKSRLQSLVSFELWSPDDVFLSRLVRRHFAERQLEVPAPVVEHILNSVERTPAAIARFIDGADRRALSEKRPISLRLVMQLLGGSDRVTGAGADHP